MTKLKGKRRHPKISVSVGSIISYSTESQRNLPSEQIPEGIIKTIGIDENGVKTATMENGDVVNLGKDTKVLGFGLGCNKSEDDPRQKLIDWYRKNNVKIGI